MGKSDLNEEEVQALTNTNCKGTKWTLSLLSVYTTTKQEEQQLIFFRRQFPNSHQLYT